jgi:hypothetical protein
MAHGMGIGKGDTKGNSFPTQQVTRTSRHCAVQGRRPIPLSSPRVRPALQKEQGNLRCARAQQRCGPIPRHCVDASPRSHQHAHTLQGPSQVQGRPPLRVPGPHVSPSGNQRSTHVAMALGRGAVQDAGAVRSGVSGVGPGGKQCPHSVDRGGEEQGRRATPRSRIDVGTCGNQGGDGCRVVHGKQGRAAIMVHGTRVGSRLQQRPNDVRPTGVVQGGGPNIAGGVHTRARTKQNPHHLQAAIGGCVVQGCAEPNVAGVGACPSPQQQGRYLGAAPDAVQRGDVAGQRTNRGPRGQQHTACIRAAAAGRVVQG